PRRRVALSREVVHRALHVTRREVDERVRRQLVVRPRRDDLRVAVLVHVRDDTTEELTGQVALQRPRRVRVTDRDEQVRHAAQHQALVADGLRSEIGAPSTTSWMPPIASMFSPVAVTMTSAGSSWPDSSCRPVSVIVVMRSVTIDAAPELTAWNRSPSGTRQSRWSHGL